MAACITRVCEMLACLQRRPESEVSVYPSEHQIGMNPEVPE